MELFYGSNEWIKNYTALEEFGEGCPPFLKNCNPRIYLAEQIECAEEYSDQRSKDDHR